tara:strand:+ start:750 stop:1130 length:381 start_codon:yes stop_codon:yes gene_type:complete
MKEVLFVFFATINNWLMSKINNFTENITLMTVYSSHAIYFLIDESRVEYLKSILEQQDLIDELDVVNSIDKIKNNAIDVGGWNEEHELELNSCGSILHNEYDWDVEEVHRYLLEVIEQADSTMTQD